MSPAGPLHGTTVVELAGLGPAPFAGMMLAEMGAEVIRVDRPTPGALATFPARSDLFGRGKKSVVLDLKDPDAVEAVLTLCADADVLIEGYRPGVAERLGVGPEQVWERNAALVYGRMTGWGQDGPRAATAGHDVGYIAITGALGAIGEAGGPPQIPVNLLGDFGGGSTYLVIGVLAALLEARRTGRGQVVDAAISDGATHLLTGILAMLASDRWTDDRGVNIFDGGAPYYAVYETADHRYMAVGALEPQFFRELVEILELDVDPAQQEDRTTWPALRQELQNVFRLRTQADWTAVFDGTDACVAPVESLRSAAVNPHMAARETLVEIDGVLQPRPAPRFSAHANRVADSAPEPGSDTREVLERIGRPDLAEKLTGGSTSRS